MPTADTQIPTERASRYLVQLCRHLGQMSRMRHEAPSRPGGQLPPTVEQVDWSDTVGTVRFCHGMCTLSATADTLTVRIDADDEDTLLRLKDGVTRRLETIGRRDHLTVHWQQSDSAAGLPSDATVAVAATRHASAARSRRIGRTLALAGVAVVAVLVHVGLFGGAVAASPWASWGANIVLELLTKLGLVGGMRVVGLVLLLCWLRLEVHDGTT